MMQAISTKFLGPTNARGRRILVKAQAGRMTVPWDDALGIEENHRAAAMAFVKRWEWYGVWVDGGAPDGTGNVYVCVQREHTGVDRERCGAIHGSVNGTVYVANPSLAIEASHEEARRSMDYRA